MKNNKGITLIVIMITVVVLAMLTGVIVTSVGNTYENSRAVQFSSYMQMIQKQVDIYVEEGTDYETLGRALNTEMQERLYTILESDIRGLIDTTDVTSDKIRYFSSSDIDEDFGISEINDEVVVNFANREVISLNGVEKGGYTYYVLRGLQ